MVTFRIIVAILEARLSQASSDIADNGISDQHDYLCYPTQV